MRQFMKDHDFKGLIKRRGASMLTVMIVFILMAEIVFLTVTAVSQIKAGQRENTQKISSLIGDVHELQTTGNKLQEQNKSLVEKNNYLIELNICLSQAILGGSFTTREECQQKVSEGIQSGQITQAVVQPAPQPNPQPAQPPQPTPEGRNCTIELLGICI